MLRYASFAIVAGLVLACAHAKSAEERPQGGAAPIPESPASSQPSATPIIQDAGSIEQLLAGRIAGVTVTSAYGGGIRVRMSGPTSFYSSQEPLIIVDGVPVVPENGGTLSWLNPHDIESIQALRDPSQTAIYGVRGANGVIIIKTKGAH